MGDHVLKPVRKIKPAGLNKNMPEDFAVGAFVQGIDVGLSPSVTPVVFLVDFSDRPQHRVAADFPPLFFDTGPSDKSVANYWSEVSYGSFTVTGNSTDIQGWLRPGVDFPSTITLNSQLTDIVSGIDSGNFLTLLGDLILFLDSGIDFSRYDSNGDGVVDSAIFVHSGWGAEDSGDPANDIWSQTLFFTGSPIITGDGVNIEDVVIVPEEKFYNDPQFVATGTGLDNGDEDLIGIGVIVHEMGHLMGLPDLYPTTTQGGVTSDLFSGVGVFDLMGYGLWGNTALTDQDTPSHLSAWSKADLNWVDPDMNVLSASGQVNLSPVEVQPDVAKVFINGTADSTQYILIENRQQSVSWIFDNALPGTGILIWHIDETVINGDLLGTGITNRERNVVNINGGFKGIDVEEADGGDELDLPISGPLSFGEGVDFFNNSSQIFDRDNPNPGQNETNSSPIVSRDPAANNGSEHLLDNRFDISLANFTVDPSLDIQFDFTIISPPSSPEWKTFNQVSTDPSQGFPGGPIISDNISVINQDSSNALWFGTVADGISKLAGRDIEQFTSASDGLPSDGITAFEFDDNTGVMWVGTDNGLAKMRNRGAGFVVISLFTTTSNPDRFIDLGLPSNVVNDLAIDGFGFLRVATDNGMALIDDNGTDSDSDDVVLQMLTGVNVKTVAVSQGGNITPTQYDPVLAGDDGGNLYRSDNGDPRDLSDFTIISLSLNPDINDLSVDPLGFIWIGTQNNGVLVYDDNFSIDTSDDSADALDLDDDPATTSAIYIRTDRNIASDRVTGIAFQELQGTPLVFFSHLRDLAPNDGGVTRLDRNVPKADWFVPGEGLTIFREDPGVPPEDETSGPASNTVRGAFTDESGNIWFSTNLGASRFGNAGILSLDSTAYFNLDAVATVTLEDDGLNIDPSVADEAVVFVVSSIDSTGIFLILVETGSDTGIFTGRFGFTFGLSGETAGGLKVIQIERGGTVTVTYNDLNPPGERTAEALWRQIIPFDDDLFIEGCFIATSAFGSYASPMVKVFRQVRDDWLLKTTIGKRMTSAYYRFSPRGARFIKERAWARIVARSTLVPLGLFLHCMIKMSAYQKVCATAGTLVILLVLCVLRNRTEGEKYP